MNTRIKLLIIGAVFTCVQGYSQNVTPVTANSAGGSAVIAGNTYEWSFGEMVLVSTSQAGNLIVTQGLLQPVSSMAGIEEISSLPGLFVVYPVPTDQILMLEPHFETGGKLQWVLYETRGKQIQSRSVQLVSGTETQTLDLAALPAANYFLRVQFESATGGIKYASYTVQKL